MSNEGEGAPMNRPKFDWTINISTMLALGAAVLAVGGYLLSFRDTVNGNTRDIVDLKAAQVESVLKAVETDRRVSATEEIRYRVQAVEEALKATNARVDASLSNISTGLREINQTVGGLATNVAVLTQRLDQAGAGRRAALEPIVPR